MPEIRITLTPRMHGRFKAMLQELKMTGQGWFNAAIEEAVSVWEAEKAEPVVADADDPSWPPTWRAERAAQRLARHLGLVGPVTKLRARQLYNGLFWSPQHPDWTTHRSELGLPLTQSEEELRDREILATCALQAHHDPPNILLEEMGEAAG